MADGFDVIGDPSASTQPETPTNTVATYDPTITIDTSKQPHTDSFDGLKSMSVPSLRTCVDLYTAELLNLMYAPGYPSGLPYAQQLGLKIRESRQAFQSATIDAIINEDRKAKEAQEQSERRPLLRIDAQLLYPITPLRTSIPRKARKPKKNV